MSLTVSGKDKAARVPLGYFGSAGAGRRLVAWVVFLGGLALFGGAVALGFWKSAASPGPVHSVHAAWENDCNSCHAPFRPTSTGNGLNTFLRGKTTDDLCQKCHQGPPHHASREIAAEVGTCASCHTDHRGRGAFLSRVSDAKCTCCHANLDAHTQGGDAQYAKHINRFERDHPQFRLGTGADRKPLGEGARDPGRMRFSHSVHLEQGQGVAWSFAQIKDASLRKRYMEMQKRLVPEQEVSESDLVKLDCASCHRLDATDDPGRQTPLRTPGEYMLPVMYEQHCRACHPLTFSTSFPNVEVPHLLQPPAVKQFLWGVFAERTVADADVRKRLLSDDRPLPGANLTAAELEARKKVDGLVGESASVLFERDAEKAARFVFKGKAACGLCHVFESPKDSLIPAKILPINVPEVWFPHAKFSHKAHRGVKCADCHHDVEKSEKADDILIPGVQSCRECHSSARTESGVQRGGVRQDCVTCHRYHHGDEPLAGLGAAARGVKQRRGMAEWLRGK